MQLFNKKPKLKRKEIAKKLYNYCKSNNDDNKLYIYNYIKIVEDYMSKSSFESDKNFLMMGRKKFLFDEFNGILNNSDQYKQIDEKLRFVLGNLNEFIVDINFVSLTELMELEKEKGFSVSQLKNKNDDYYKKGYICLEEKQYIVNMINAIKERID